ncbi:MAG: MarR family winged helix-turn-helix transcriptional regulator [Kibdelosporangium sp.]
MTGERTGGPALFRLVRFWSRRWANQAAATAAGDVPHILVVEAVHAAGEATVNAVAHQLGLDHSGASRMVRDATAGGYLVRAESDQDRRRVLLRLTEQGEELLAGARNWQNQVFDELTGTWSAKDKAQFAGYLRRLAGELGV